MDNTGRIIIAICLTVIAQGAIAIAMASGISSESDRIIAEIDEFRADAAIQRQSTKDAAILIQTSVLESRVQSAKNASRLRKGLLALIRIEQQKLQHILLRADKRGNQ
jgi:hypothetical protein